MVVVTGTVPDCVYACFVTAYTCYMQAEADGARHTVIWLDNVHGPVLETLVSVMHGDSRPIVPELLLPVLAAAVAFQVGFMSNH